MPRAKTVVPGKARRKKTLNASKGAYMGRRKLIRTAQENVLRALQYAYRDRKQRKRQMRRLWILRINAASRQCGISYNRLIEGLRKASMDIDRKLLSDLAVHDMAAFAELAEVARKHVHPAAGVAPQASIHQESADES